MTNIVKLDTLTTAMAIAEKHNICGNLCSAHLMVYNLPKIAQMHVHARNAGLAIYANENFCDILPADHISEYVSRVGESPASKQYRGKFYAYLSADQIEKTLTALFEKPETEEAPKTEEASSTESDATPTEEAPTPTETPTEAPADKPKKNRRNSKNKSNKS